jgi:hypothetical protein
MQDFGIGKPVFEFFLKMDFVGGMRGIRMNRLEKLNEWKFRIRNYRMRVANQRDA